MHWWLADLFHLSIVYSVHCCRGDIYNGYPNNSGYFGSFCLDGVAVALHSFAHTLSPVACLQACINHRGDCDSTTAVAGQLAGAYYGAHCLPAPLLNAALRWDDGDHLLRAVMLTTAFRTTARQEVVDGSTTRAAAAAAAVIEHCCGNLHHHRSNILIVDIGVSVTDISDLVICS